MKPAEFVDLCVRCGYCHRSIAEGYVIGTGRSEFTDKDFEEVFRLAERPIRDRRILLSKRRKH